MRNYCTLSDRVYLPKLLALHESLVRHSSEDSRLYILAMDLQTGWIVDELKLDRATVIPLATFERELNLKPVRESRTHQEYCWTCASSLLDYMLRTVGDCTYLDADLFFFSDPLAIFDEIGGRSIGITPHRFPASRKHKEENGRFNVGWVSAVANTTGKVCISRWAQQCREWCFNRVEAHHACGDQKYLDVWPIAFPGEVCEISNAGVNLAPWNIEQYRIAEGPTVDEKPVVFYHYHEFESPVNLTGYPMRSEDLKYIYAPYISGWNEAAVKVSYIEAIWRTEHKAIEVQAIRA